MESNKLHSDDIMILNKVLDYFSLKKKKKTRVMLQINLLFWASSFVCVCLSLALGRKKTMSIIINEH